MILNNFIAPYDYIIIVFISILLIFFFIKGFIQSILSLLTWIGSILITIYSYESLANFITKQFLKINYINHLESWFSIFGLICSIPIIFLISLFILKRIRKFLSSELDKQVLGIILDKLFGLIYGIIFSYIIITTMIIILQKYEERKAITKKKNNVL